MYIKKLKCYICGFEQEHHTDKWIKIKVNEEWHREHICPKCVMAISVLRRISGTPISKRDQRTVKKYISNEDGILERLWIKQHREMRKKYKEK